MFSFSVSGIAVEKTYKFPDRINVIWTHTGIERKVAEMKRICLLIIDPQNSYCAVPPDEEKGLGNSPDAVVSGAIQCMERTAHLIDSHGKELWSIQVVLQQRSINHISHGIWFQDKGGKSPPPWTKMWTDTDGRFLGTHKSFKGATKRFDLRYPQLGNRIRKYMVELEQRHRRQQVIQPIHCLIGSWGANITRPLHHSLLRWESVHGAMVDIAHRGQNLFTDHTSVFVADIPDPFDLTTHFNIRLAMNLNNADEIWVAGIGWQGAIENSLNDLKGNFRDGMDSKIILLDDCICHDPRCIVSANDSV